MSELKPFVPCVNCGENALAKKEDKEHKHESDPHEELAKIMPRSVNFAKCPNGDCTKGLIKNAKGITRKFKSCPNCKNNSVPKKGDYCPTCGLTDEDLEKHNEEWDDSDLDIPVKEEDD